MLSADDQDGWLADDLVYTQISALFCHTNVLSFM